MPPIQAIQSLSQDRNLPWLIAGVGAMIATWVIYQSRGTINNDGVLYIEAARLFDAGQGKEGYATYNWPFYSLLIVLVHKASGLDFQSAAHLLAVLFFASACAGMARLVREAGGGRQTMLLAALLFLASPYLVGDILPMVVRDHGYWAFHIWSLVFFLRFLKERTWKNTLYWGMFATFCVLFRIEGLTYLILLPMILLIDPSFSPAARWRTLLKANATLMALSIGLTILLLAHPTLKLSDMGRLQDPILIMQLVYEQLAHGLSSRAEVIAEQVLGNFLDDYAMSTLLAGMVVILATKALTVGGWLQSGLALYYWNKTKRTLRAEHFRFFGWLLILGFMNAAVILIKGFVLPKRILSPVGFILITFAAFGAASFIEEVKKQRVWGSNPGRWAILAVIVVLVIQLANILRPSDPRNRYERDAVEWVLSEAPPESRIYFQTERMRFYAGLPLQREDEWVAIQRSRWQQALEGMNEKRLADKELPVNFHEAQEIAPYDYFLFRSNNKKSEQEKFLAARFGTPLAVFEGPRGNRILVYRGANANP